MTEDDYIDEIHELWDRPLEAFALAEQAVQDYPDSADLWCMRGDLLQLVDLDDGPSPYPLDEVLRCYREAVRLDPNCADAYEEIGYYYHDFTDDFPSAATAFREAIRLDGSKSAYLGLGRVLADMGDVSGALAALDACPERDDSDVVELRREIVGG